MYGNLACSCAGSRKYLSCLHISTPPSSLCQLFIYMCVTVFMVDIYVHTGWRWANLITLSCKGLCCQQQPCRDVVMTQA